ncbi:MAG: Bax inhibitor-1 family protein [Myxococcota bacterium]|nr:Bax inhibitor-1 family protein [Myxococcota bacterium]
MLGSSTAEGHDVFSRRTTDQPLVSRGVYNLTIGAVLCWGFGLNYWMVTNIAPEAPLVYGFWPFIIGYFVCCFVGIMMFTSSDNPLISFVGYNLVVIPFGLVVNTVVAGYDPHLVVEAVQVTGAITFIMMVMGSAFPKFFIGLGRILSMALLAMIIIELLAVFVFNWDRNIIDYAVAGIFCGYIGYDWARANSIPPTIDNAVDSAASIYMDVVNLFLRVLRIMGRR